MVDPSEVVVVARIAKCVCDLVLDMNGAFVGAFLEYSTGRSMAIAAKVFKKEYPKL